MRGSWSAIAHCTPLALPHKMTMAHCTSRHATSPLPSRSPQAARYGRRRCRAGRRRLSRAVRPHHDRRAGRGDPGRQRQPVNRSDHDRPARRRGRRRRCPRGGGHGPHAGETERDGFLCARQGGQSRRALYERAPHGRGDDVGRKARPEAHARRRRAGDVVQPRQGAAARTRRGRAAVRSQGRRRSRCATARAATSCARTAAACRSSGWSAPTAGACSSISRSARSISPAPKGTLTPCGRRAAARRVRHGVARSGRDHRASTRASPDCAELPALWTFGYMQSHRTLAGPGRDHVGRADVPREEAAVRRADLSRHRVHAVGLEHAQRRVHAGSRRTFPNRSR